MAKSIKAITAELADREAIRDCIYRVSRAVDRAEMDIWRECFWPEATDSHSGLYSGPMVDLLELALPFLGKFKATSHIITNVLIDIDGDFAKAESYTQAYHIQEEPEALNIIGTGRFLDRFERRGDEWRLINRNLVLDWFMNVPRGGEWSCPHFGHEISGQRVPDDFSYRFFADGPKVETVL